MGFCLRSFPTLKNSANATIVVFLAVGLVFMATTKPVAAPQAPPRPQGGSLAAQAFAPQEVVDAALSLVGLNPKDTLVDLGSGDGRVVIAAARRGARATGLDIDAELVAAARREAASLGLGLSARFETQDFLKADVREATVVFVYLSREGMEKVRQQVVPGLRKGSRLVSVTYDMPGWEPSRTEFVKDAQGVRYVLYMWIIA